MLLRFERLIPDELLQAIQAKLVAADFEDGRQTAGLDAMLVKNNRQLAPQSPLNAELGALVLQRISASPELAAVLFPRKFSQPLFSAYEPGMEYGQHVDNALMVSPRGQLRTDIAMTVFLSAPESYGGGELVIEDSGLGHHRIKLPAGSAVAYPGTSLHRVAPVTSGRRLACVLWMQSHIRDPGQRRILIDLEMAAGGMRKRAPDSNELKLVAAAYQNLMRLWADV